MKENQEEAGKTMNNIAEMFAKISPTYDALNGLLSFGLDRFWRSRLVNSLPVKRGEILDCCTGTGDLAILLSTRGYEVTGIDFCKPMLEKARAKAPKGVSLKFIEADANQLPFPNGSFQAVTNAFSLRNLPNLKTAFLETYRVLTPGGTALFLDLTRPQGWIAPLHRFYLNTILPGAGKVISGDKEAYRYLSQSILNFQPPFQIMEILASCSFSKTSLLPLSGGICTLWTALK